MHWEWFWWSSICIFWHMWKFKPCSLSGTQLQKQWIVDAWEILGLLYFQSLCWSPIYSHHSGIFKHPSYSFPPPFFLISFHSIFFFLCTIFALHTTFKISLVLRVSSKPSREANACPTVSTPTDSVSTQGYLDAFIGRIDSDFSLLISLLFFASTNAILLHPLRVNYLLEEVCYSSQVTCSYINTVDFILPNKISKMPLSTCYFSGRLSSKSKPDSQVFSFTHIPCRRVQ